MKRANKELQMLYIYDPVLKSYLNIFYECNYKELNKYISETYNVTVKEDDSDDGCFFKIKDSDTQEEHYCIWIRKIKNNTHAYSKIIHELVHYLFQIFYDRGIKVGKNNDEIFAYFQQFYFEKIYKKLFNKPKK